LGRGYFSKECKIILKNIVRLVQEALEIINLPKNVDMKEELVTL